MTDLEKFCQVLDDLGIEFTFKKDDSYYRVD
jgi:hypothetical protein